LALSAIGLGELPGRGPLPWDNSSPASLVTLSGMLLKNAANL
jgi:hypothetical protein